MKIRRRGHPLNPAPRTSPRDPRNPRNQTTSLHMNYPDARAIAASFAWDDGKATAITLWHPNIVDMEIEDEWR
jgi:hypothetical protein